MLVFMNQVTGGRTIADYKWIMKREELEGWHEKREKRGSWPNTNKSTGFAAHIGITFGLFGVIRCLK
jgi:hypothetical protein